MRSRLILSIIIGQAVVLAALPSFAEYTENDRSILNSINSSLNGVHTDTASIDGRLSSIYRRMQEDNLGRLFIKYASSTVTGFADILADLMLKTSHNVSHSTVSGYTTFSEPNSDAYVLYNEVFPRMLKEDQWFGDVQEGSLLDLFDKQVDATLVLTQQMEDVISALYARDSDTNLYQMLESKLDTLIANGLGGGIGSNEIFKLASLLSPYGSLQNDNLTTFHNFWDSDNYGMISQYGIGYVPVFEAFSRVAGYNAFNEPDLPKLPLLEFYNNPSNTIFANMMEDLIYECFPSLLLDDVGGKSVAMIANLNYALYGTRELTDYLKGQSNVFMFASQLDGSTNRFRLLKDETERICRDELAPIFSGIFNPDTGFAGVEPPSTNLDSIVYGEIYPTPNDTYVNAQSQLNPQDDSASQDDFFTKLTSWVNGALPEDSADNIRLDMRFTQGLGVAVEDYEFNFYDTKPAQAKRKIDRFITLMIVIFKLSLWGWGFSSVFKAVFRN